MSPNRCLLTLVVLLPLASCLPAVGVVCEDGTLCPDDTSCATVGGDTRCVIAEQRDQCARQPDRTPCSYTGVEAGLCHDQVCVRAGCGDGFATGSEQCDGADLAGVVDCRALGYYDPGTIACDDDCRFDRAGCEASGKCGDGVINGDEQCDCAGGECTSAQLDDATCTTAGGYYTADGLGCNSACRYEFTACRDRCGDGVVQAGEECDGAALAGKDDCTDLGYYGAGTLQCQANCVYDRGTCAAQGVCGDGMINGGEPCDGAAFAPASDACTDISPVAGHPFYGGTIGCLPNCQVDTTQCTGFCGDGIANGAEPCDRFDFKGATCADYNRYTGSLACDANCVAIDPGACSGFCGDGVINGSEACDVANGGVVPAGLDCRAYGYNEGDLGCAAGCATITTTSCEAGGYCGDGIVQATEACDGAEQSGDDCGIASGRGPLDCDAACSRSLRTCEDSAWQRQTVTSALGFLPLRDVWSENPSSTWVVSDREIRNWDGARWIDRTPPSPVTGLRAVWGARGNVWVGGDGVYRWNPNSGVFELEAGSPMAVHDLWGVEDRVFAATDLGLYERLATGQWQLAVNAASIPILGMFRALHGRGDTVIAVGAIGQGLVYRWLAGTWAAYAFTDFNGSSALIAWQSVSVLSRDRFFLVPQGGARDVFYVDGPQGRIIPVEDLGPNTNPFITHVYAAADDDVWALGEITSGSGGGMVTRPAMFHFAGYHASFGQLSPRSVGTIPTSPALVGLGAGRVFVIGDSALLRYEGPSWGVVELGNMPPSSPTTGLASLDHPALAVSPDGVWIAGCAIDAQGDTCGQPESDTNLVEYRVRDHYSAMFPGDVAYAYATHRADPATCGLCSSGTGTPRVAITAIAIDGAGWVLAAGNGVVRAIANTKFRTTAAPPAPPRSPPLSGGETLAGAWAGGGIAAFGVNPAAPSAANPAALLVLSGGGWQRRPIVDAIDPADVLFQVQVIAGTSATDVWVAGRGATDTRIAHWNGASWSLSTPADTSVGAPPPQRITGLWVSGPGDVWVVGDRVEIGVILRGDGANWRTIDLGVGLFVPQLRAIWGSSTRDIWVADALGTAYHHDGLRWTPITTPGANIRAIAGTGADDVWAVGDNNMIMRLTHALPGTTGGACADAIPIYCDGSALGAEVTATLAVGGREHYRLISPVDGQLEVTLTSLVGDQELVARAGRADSPSTCDAGMPSPGDQLSRSLQRGAWTYLSVENPTGQPAGRYRLRWKCTFVPAP